MFRTSIQFLSIFLTIGASVLLLKGNLGLGIEAIRETAATKFTINPAVVWSLASQQADTRVGLALLLLGVVLQVGNAAWPMRLVDFSVSPKGVFLALGVAGLLMAGAWTVLEKVAAATVEKVRALNDAEHGKSPDKTWEKP